MGEVGIAVVVPTDPERPPDLSELIAHAGDYLSHYKLPSDLRIVDVLPLNAGDKVDRRSLVAHEAAKS